MSTKKVSSLNSLASEALGRTSEPPQMAPPRFIASSSSGKGFETLTREQFEVHRTPPAGAFDRCEKQSLSGGWLDSIRLFRDWALGSGPDRRIFGTCSPQSQNMADAFDVNRARQYIYRTNEGVPFEKWKSVTNFSGAFGPIELVAAGLDPTEQFVGSYRVDIFPQPDRTLRFEVTNNTSMESFLYGAGPEYERKDFAYGGNMRQVYTWTEPVELP